MKFPLMLRKFLRGESIDVTKYSQRQRDALSTRLHRAADLRPVASRRDRLRIDIWDALSARPPPRRRRPRFKGRGMYEEYDSPDNEGLRSVRKVPESASSDAYKRDLHEMYAANRHAANMKRRGDVRSDRAKEIMRLIRSRHPLYATASQRATGLAMMDDNIEAAAQYYNAMHMADDEYEDIGARGSVPPHEVNEFIADEGM